MKKNRRESIPVEDVLPGDWARHRKSPGLPQREVHRIEYFDDRAPLVWFDFAGTPSGPYVAMDYDYSRPALPEPRDFVCPDCNAQVGASCTRPTSTGRSPVEWFHISREALANEYEV